MPYFSFLEDDANVMHVLAHRKSWSVSFEKALNEVMRGPDHVGVNCCVTPRGSLKACNVVPIAGHYRQLNDPR